VEGKYEIVDLLVMERGPEGKRCTASRRHDEVGSRLASEVASSRDIVVVYVRFEHMSELETSLFDHVEEASNIALGIDNDGVIARNCDVGRISETRRSDSDDLHMNFFTAEATDANRAADAVCCWSHRVGPVCSYKKGQFRTR
jgi:hypothetical protein